MQSSHQVIAPRDASLQAPFCNLLKKFAFSLPLVFQSSITPTLQVMVAILKGQDMLTILCLLAFAFADDDTSSKRKAIPNEWEELPIPVIQPLSCKTNADAVAVQFNLPELTCSENYKVDLSFKNDFLFPVEIESVATSCGCIRTYVPEGKFDSGQMIPFRLVLQSPQKPGAFQKQVLLNLHGDRKVYLAISGEAKSPLVILPNHLSTKDLRKGDVVEFALTWNTRISERPDFRLNSDFLTTVDFSLDGESQKGKLRCAVQSVPEKTSYAIFICQGGNGVMESALNLRFPLEIELLPRMIDVRNPLRLALIGEDLSGIDADKLRLVDSQLRVLAVLRVTGKSKKILKLEGDRIDGETSGSMKSGFLLEGESKLVEVQFVK